LKEDLDIWMQRGAPTTVGEEWVEAETSGGGDDAGKKSNVREASRRRGLGVASNSPPGEAGQNKNLER
jgi:hypothetical protein